MLRSLFFCLLILLPALLTAQTANEQFQMLLDTFWNYNPADTPPTPLPPVSVELEAEKAADFQQFRKQLAEIDRSQLDVQQRINYDMLELELDNRLSHFEAQTYLMPINSEGGFHTGFMYRMGRMRLETLDDYEHYIRTLNDFPRYVQDHIQLMRLGLEKGVTQPAVILKGAPKGLDIHLVEDAEESYFYESFEDLPNSFTGEQQDRLRAAAKKAILESVVRGYADFKTFLEEEYFPNGRKVVGVSAIPGGKTFYEQQVRYFTTLEMSPDAVFEKGQQEVRRIRAEMDSIIRAVNFDGTFDEFLAFLRTDAQFYAKTPKELLQYASFLAKKVDGKLPAYFNTLPRLPYGVAPVPDAIAPTYTGGRYVPGSVEGHRAGTYWVNTYNLPSRPLYVLPSLTLHEAVPGHHLQMALAQELENQHPFRQQTYLSAFGEGWALYCEFLGNEMGMYETPYEQFGRLTYEMWRACRLVVDVGLHYKGWTREEAVDFLANNTALSLHEVNTEIDRYIGWPGQAVSYKIGELTIRELRKEAEAALGDAFDIRAFHDVILQNGAVPLTILEEQVRAYIEEERAKKKE